MVSQTPVHSAPFYPDYYQRVIEKGPFFGRRVVLLGLSFDAHFRALAALTNFIFSKVQGWFPHQSGTDVEELRQSWLSYWQWSVLFWAGCFRPTVVLEALHKAQQQATTTSSTDERRARSAQTDSFNIGTPDSFEDMSWPNDSRAESPNSDVPALPLGGLSKAHGQTVTPSDSGGSTKVSNWERKNEMQLAGYQVVPFIVKNRVSRNQEEGYGQECTYERKQIPFMALISGKRGAPNLSKYCSYNALGPIFKETIERATNEDFGTILNDAFEGLKSNLRMTYDKTISLETKQPILKQNVIIFVLVIAQKKLWKLNAHLTDLTTTQTAEHTKAEITSIPLETDQSILMTSEHFNQATGSSFSALSVEQTQSCLYIAPSRPSEPGYDQIPDLEEILEHAGELVPKPKILVVSRTTNLEMLLAEESRRPSASLEFTPVYSDPDMSAQDAQRRFNPGEADTPSSDGSYVLVPPLRALGTLSKESSPVGVGAQGGSALPDMPARYRDLKPT